MGGSGHDKLFGGFGRNVLIGGEGPDRLFGGFGRDWFFSGAGDWLDNQMLEEVDESGS